MSVKKHLRKEIYRIHLALKKKIGELENASVILENSHNERDYIVTLNSFWGTHGEKSPVIRHRGNLKQAIEKAEEKFRTVNNRRDIQARYSVRIVLGRVELTVPAKYWEAYKTE